MHPRPLCGPPTTRGSPPPTSAAWWYRLDPTASTLNGPISWQATASPQREVWVELGLQSACDATLRRLRRGHGVAEFIEAFGLLRERGIRVAPHLIFGLPGEGWDRVEETVDLVAGLKPDGVKIHNLHMPAGTALLGEALAGEVPVFSVERHLDYVVRALERLPQSAVVLRLTCDTPADRLALPRHSGDKAAFHRLLAAEMLRRDTWQGRLRGEPLPCR